MLSSRLVFLSLSASLAIAAASLNACGDDPAPATPDDGGASSSSSTSSSSGGASSSSSGGSSSSSSGGGGDSGCPDPEDAAPPDLDGGGLCGTLGFGKAAAAFQGIVDASDNGPYQGGDFPQGIYDAVIAERFSGNAGSWRETFVVGPDSRFTRIRQTNLDGGPVDRPATFRSGTLVGDAGSLRLQFDCAFDEDASVVDPSDTIPYEVVNQCGKIYYRYGGAGVRIWLQRR